MFKKILFALVFCGLYLTTQAQALHQNKVDEVAVISMDRLSEAQGDNTVLTYTKGLVDKGIVPLKSSFHFAAFSNLTELSTQVKTFYNQGVRFFIGPFIVDDIQAIRKALPQTNQYVIISTAYVSHETSFDNVIRFNVSNEVSLPYRLALYRKEFGSLKPIVLYGPTHWAKSESQIYQSIALKTIAFTNPKDLTKIISTQIPNTTSPIIVLSSNVAESLAALPKVANPILLSDLAIFFDMTKIHNDNLNHLHIFAIATDVQNMINFQIGKNIVGKTISPYISNLIYAMYFATDTINSGQTTGSIYHRVLNIHDNNGSALLNKNGEANIFSTLMASYNPQKQNWEVIRKIDVYDDYAKFNCQNTLDAGSA